MFPVRSQGAGTLRAERRSCPVCGTRKIATREDGLSMCKNGHEQAGVVYEDVENIADGSTRRHTKSAFARQNKATEARSKRLYGVRARFLTIEILQLILKTQATALVSNHGAPEALLGIVRNLWLLYVSKLPNIDKVVDDEDDEQITQAQTQSATLLADALFSQHTQAQSFDPVDDSLDILLRRVDDDIARDEEEMMEWDREFQTSDHEDLGEAPAGRANDNSLDGVVGGDKEGQLAESAGASGHQRPAYRHPLERVEKYPKMEYLPTLLCVAYRMLRMPVLFADMFRLLVDERIPYTSAYLNLPKSIRERTGVGFPSLFQPKFAPSAFRLRFLTGVFSDFFAKHYSIEVPLTDTPSMLLLLIKRLGLRIEIYSMVMRILELTSVQPNLCFGRAPRPEVMLIGAVVVVLKMHYGLDEIERRPPPDATYRVPNLPPLHVFLDKWRSDWEAELTIGVFPHLTALGEQWEVAFTQFCRRLMTRREIPDNKVSYKEIAAKYRRMLQTAATEGGMSAQRAQRVLPPEYCASRPAESQSQHKGEAADDSSSASSFVSRCVLPIQVPSATDCDTPASGSSKRPLMTHVKPFYHHPEIQLEPGEHFISINDHKSSEYAPGYMVPTLGLVYARCAAVVGCSQSMLSNFIIVLEHRIDQAIHRTRTQGRAAR
ncbi:hypothetical protein GGI18_002519 [Coemansia linderi]|uniref:Uncharacterized protein n=1 Tax=Coemansia linderi TaxID=2663919 RepID=A0ACC1KFS9_9FUNG|nr:hypothetical protein GGI18_002519 [Coemansia linderi]